MIPAAASLRSRYAQMDIPVEIFAVLADEIVDAESHSGRLHRDLKNSTLATIPGVGHVLHYTDAARIVESVDKLSR